MEKNAIQVLEWLRNANCGNAGDKKHVLKADENLSANPTYPAVILFCNPAQVKSKHLFKRQSVNKAREELLQWLQFSSSSKMSPSLLLGYLQNDYSLEEVFEPDVIKTKAPIILTSFF